MGDIAWIYASMKDKNLEATQRQPSKCNITCIADVVVSTHLLKLERQESHTSHLGLTHYQTTKS